MAKTYKVTDKDGRIIEPGDPVMDFRGETHVFESVSRAPAPGKSALVIVSGRECYCTVYDLTVTVVEEVTS